MTCRSVGGRRAPLLRFVAIAAVHRLLTVGAEWHLAYLVALAAGSLKPLSGCAARCTIRAGAKALLLAKTAGFLNVCHGALIIS